MLRKGNEQSIAGNGNRQTIIENAVIQPQLKLSSDKSVIHSLLVSAFKVLDDEETLTTDFDLSLPNKVEEKLRYNGVVRYEEILVLAAVRSYNLEVVLSDFDRSEKLVRAVAGIYQRVAISKSFQPSVAETGRMAETIADRVLVEVEERICGRIKADPDYVSENYTYEEIEDFVVSLIYYCLERCKVLERVPEE